MATLVEQAPSMPSRPATPPQHLSLNTSLRGTPAPVPNKHIPVCSPGTAPALNTPPSSPPSKSAPFRKPSSLLHPPDKYPKISDSPLLYSIEPSAVHDALEHYATQPLLDPKLVFPWLHGLHPENSIQLAFFVQRRRAPRRIPKELRAITIVKTGGDLSNSKLKGAIGPDEILSPDSLTNAPSEARFYDPDPKEGFSVRNFHIQTAKMALVSDIIVYGDDNTPQDNVLDLASRLSHAQAAARQSLRLQGLETPSFHTFVVIDPFTSFPAPIIATDAKGALTGAIHDFFLSERFEMATMTRASRIADHVYLGPTPDAVVSAACPDDPPWDVFVEASDLAQVPDEATLKDLKDAMDGPEKPTVHFDVPASGAVAVPTWSSAEVDGLMRVCKWIWEVTHPTPSSEDTTPGAEDKDGDTPMSDETSDEKKPKTVLIHCPDGYTESSLLGLTYHMYATAQPLAQAWLSLHRSGRNFFAYPTDVALLQAIQCRILNESPVRKTALQGTPSNIYALKDPSWMTRFDGSLPSRVTPYMYLGNLNHANNVELLKELGIGQVVSVGERVCWEDAECEVLGVEGVQDNGVDGLGTELERCLDFIAQGKEKGTATLVHCRVGVSRSATICIAEVMKTKGLSFPQAYCFVRARRLNVIIQPHLRFTYELLKWEEELRVRRGQPLRRELEWASVSREIAAMNRPYSRG